MSELIYFTREQSSTYGKPRIYLSFHKSDREEYVSKLRDDILQINNCALFMYDEGAAPEGEDLPEIELRQMQLFILVCTASYLQEQYHLKDREISFAITRGIPVLPIILGNNPVNEFNAMCAGLGLESLHGLDKNQFAGNEEGYHEKLREYLDYFLINDEEANNIQNQFRATIFLSYRKIDRDYARNLIRRIHNLQKYIDVAVWYDDYLVPGRSFEKEIFEAMDKSDLFVLAVTNNICALNDANEDNYVVKTEYPEAVKRGKKIIAAELEKTDKQTLLIKFGSSLECFDAYNDALLEKELSPLDDMPATSGPIHDYYIGLAYLFGLNAEVDNDKAFDLISSAAKNGLEEAMDRMVRMYRSGIAVERNYSKAIEWQEKLVRKAEDVCIAEDTPEAAHHLIYRLGQLGNYLLETHNEEEAYKTCQREIDIACQYAEKYRLSDLYRDVSVACNKLGDIHLKKKEFKAAEECFRQGYRAAGVIYEELNTTWAKRDYAISCQKLGETCRFQGLAEDALEFYKKAYELTTELEHDEPTAANQRDLYILTAMLGDTEIMLHNSRLAEEYYLNSLKLRETINKELDSDWSYRDLSVIWEKLADLYVSLKRTADVSRAYEEAVYLADTLYERTKTLAHEMELSKLCSRTGDFYLECDNKEEAAYYLKSAIEIDERLLENIGTCESMRDLELNCNSVGGIMYDLGQKEESAQYYKKGICVVKNLISTEDSPVYQDDLAILYYNLFRTAFNAEDLVAAYEIWRALHSSYPDNETYAQRLSLVQGILEDL